MHTRTRTNTLQKDTRNAWSTHLAPELHLTLLEDKARYVALHVEYNILVQGLRTALQEGQYQGQHPSPRIMTAFKRAARSKAVQLIRVGGKAAALNDDEGKRECQRAALELLEMVQRKCDVGQGDGPFIGEEECSR